MLSEAGKVIASLENKDHTSDFSASVNLVKTYFKEKNLEDISDVFLQALYKPGSAGLPVYAALLCSICKSGKPNWFL